MVGSIVFCYCTLIIGMLTTPGACVPNLELFPYFIFFSKLRILFDSLRYFFHFFKLLKTVWDFWLTKLRLAFLETSARWHHPPQRYKQACYSSNNYYKHCNKLPQNKKMQRAKMKQKARLWRRLLVKRIAINVFLILYLCMPKNAVF